MSDGDLVSLAESANFCVPSSTVYVGKSSFFSPSKSDNNMSSSNNFSQMRNAYSEVNFFHLDSTEEDSGGDRSRRGGSVQWIA